MDRATDERRTPPRMLAVLTTLGLVAGMLAVLPPGADAVVNTCKARNLTKDTPARSNLQRVIKAASAGDTISVKNVCVGHFKIGKRLILLGKAAPGHPKGVLDGNDVISSRPTLLVSARVTLTNLEITGGAWQPVGSASGGGGGIRNTGKLVLNNTLVRGNWSALNGGGVDNRGTLIMKGSSSVSGNMSDIDAGGSTTTRAPWS